jgi:hypothetical protein
MDAALERSPWLMRVILGALIVVGGTFLAVFVSSPSHAVDCSTVSAADFCTSSGSTTDAGTPTNTTSSNGVSCDKPLPSAPTVTCGTASIRYGNKPGNVGSTISGLPGTWMGWSDQYAMQCFGATVQVYNPFNGNYLTYRATGVDWKDYRYWTPQVSTSTQKLSVYIAPSYTYQEDVYGWYWKPKKKEWDYRKIGTRTVTVPQAPPVTVTTYSFTDNTLSSSNFTRQATLSSPGWNNYTLTTVTVWPLWVGRTVVYGPCIFPKAPQLVKTECAVGIGPGYMNGPFGNSATKPWPVPTGPGTHDVQTEVKRWAAVPNSAAVRNSKYWKPMSGPNTAGGVLYSDFGLAFEDPITNAIFSQKGNETAMNYVANCGEIRYKTTAKDQKCQYLGKTLKGLNGVWLDSGYTTTDPRGTEVKVCAFTYGNYEKSADRTESKCYHTHYNWDQWAQVDPNLNLFMYCTPKYFLSPYVDRAHWNCQFPNGRIGYDATTNFANPNSACQPNVTYQCRFSSAAPVIKDPSGRVVPNRSQMLPNGKQWEVFWAAPNLLIDRYVGGRLSSRVPAENQWMQWMQASNSQPYKTTLTADDGTQPIFASTEKNADPATAKSILTDLGSAKGKSGWTDSTLYLRSYKGAPANTTGATMYVGKTEGVPNFATVAPNTLIPYGTYMAFIFTYMEKITSDMGGTVEINVPQTCATDMATFYVTAGRPTS